MGSLHAKKEGLNVSTLADGVLVNNVQHPGVARSLSESSVASVSASTQQSVVGENSVDADLVMGVAGTTNVVAGIGTPNICAILMEALQVLDILRQRCSFSRANAVTLKLSKDNLDEEDNIFEQLKLTVCNLFEVNGFYLSMEEGYCVAFMADYIKDKETGELAGVIAKTVELPQLSQEDLLCLPIRFSEEASKRLAEVSLKAVAHLQPRKAVAPFDWLKAVQSNMMEKRESFNL